jgi:hypothetical protein
MYRSWQKIKITWSLLPQIQCILFCHCCAGWWFMVSFIKFLEYIKYIILVFTPSPILGITLTGINFPFIYMSFGLMRAQVSRVCWLSTILFPPWQFILALSIPLPFRFYSVSWEIALIEFLWYTSHYSITSFELLFALTFWL